MNYNSTLIKEHIKSGHIKIDPYIDKFQGPNLYYCHLGNNLLIPQAGKLADTKKISKFLYKKKKINEFYDLKPGEFILAETFETFMTDKSHVIKLHNSSSLARLGVLHCALGMINPGCGMKSPIRLTLELTNTSPFVVRLYPTTINIDTGAVLNFGTEVLKVAVSSHSEVAIPYEKWQGAIYGSDKVVTGSRIDKRFK